MALGATIFHASLDLADADRHRYLSERLTLALHPSETVERMVARLLCWCLYSGEAEEGLQFGPGLSSPGEPDLLERDLHGNPRLAVEMGEPDADRVRRSALRSARVVVMPYGRAWPQWWKRQERELQKLSRVEVVRLPWEAVDRLARDLPRTFSWQVTLESGALVVIDHRSDMITVTPEVLGA